MVVRLPLGLTLDVPDDQEALAHEVVDPPRRPLYRTVKRVADFVLSLSLVVLCLPLMVGIAVAVPLQTRQSPLFLQRRIGYREKPFTMLKFRTMYAEASAYAPSPDHAQDRRVTSIGRWLRKYSLDELPQFLNVLAGQMSIVGPRPEMPFLVDRYQPWQRQRLNAAPGMTGLWQIVGRKDLPLRDNLEYDFFYIKHQSLRLDLAIFLRTLPIVITGKGAY